MKKNLEYWKNNCEDNYRTTPISVLRYITELESIEKIKLNCTFSHLGSKGTIPYATFILDDSEFVGTEEEHHSGSFEVELDIDKDISIFDSVGHYIITKGLQQECFTVSLRGILLFTEVEFSLQGDC